VYSSGGAPSHPACALTIWGPEIRQDLSQYLRCGAQAGGGKSRPLILLLAHPHLGAGAGRGYIIWGTEINRYNSNHQVTVSLNLLHILNLILDFPSFMIHPLNMVHIYISLYIYTLNSSSRHLHFAIYIELQISCFSYYYYTTSGPPADPHLWRGMVGDLGITSSKHIYKIRFWYIRFESVIFSLNILTWYIYFEAYIYILWTQGISTYVDNVARRINDLQETYQAQEITDAIYIELIRCFSYYDTLRFESVIFYTHVVRLPSKHKGDDVSSYWITNLGFFSIYQPLR
jgi:hypothetical protein